MGCDVRLFWADRYGRERGIYEFAEGQFFVQVEGEVDFSLDIPKGTGTAQGCYVMMEDSEFGGIVDSLTVDTSKDTVTIGGRTWHGVLESALVVPDKGKDYLEASGECNAILAMLVARLNLGYIFKASAADSGFRVSGHRFSRLGSEMGGWTVMRKMLLSAGAKLQIRYSGADRRVILSAVPRGNYVDNYMDGESHAFSITKGRPVNHLHCMGTGELANRTIVDLYADAKGRVGEVQTLFGQDYNGAVYDSPSADATALREDGRKFLEQCQGELSSCTMRSEESGAYEIDDVVGGSSVEEGFSVVTSIAQKIAILKDGHVEYETKTETEV
ncbi:hypothetical protein [Parvibacter caecicola]|uniref:hypothetical protein n=1 Tax=Parvibacter caecicola TaxID=747645 RepID=UPI002499FA9D|nr:hypothetical protein [Parvibacter caecicola]